jgi:flagellar basal-body rod protein FlgB
MLLRDITGDYLKVAISGLEAARRANVDNLANVETPGFRARRVDFESALRAANGRGEWPTLQLNETRSNAPTRANGNNVAVDDEMLVLSETALRHQLVVESLNARYRLLRTAISGQ